MTAGRYSFKMVLTKGCYCSFFGVQNGEFNLAISSVSAIKVDPDSIEL